MLLRNMDGEEYTRTASDSSLLASETLELRFNPDTARNDSLALVVAQRQSLITTFLFYQALDYMGPQVGEWFSVLERMAGEYRNQSFLGQLRGIKVRALTADSGWATVGTIQERGPLASDVQLIPLPPDLRSNRIRLTMARGNYRIDFANIVSLDQRVTPRRIQPETVLHEGKPDTAARNALTTRETLTTMAGDEYRLRYRLPDQRSYAFFLETKGYYLEWMRPQWMKDAQPGKLSELIYNPRQALKKLAPKYKEIEPQMQEIFWNSRYATPNH